MAIRSIHSGDAPPTVSPAGVLAALVGAAGLTASMALLYRAMAVIMETEGGFVAAGGPYEIAHPAPDWVWLVPIAIMSLFAFGGLSLWASMRGWGVNPLAYAWSALFITLGWNFLRLGIIDPPEGQSAAWGWIVSGAAFWVMGFAPALGPIVRLRARARYGPEAFSAGVRTGPFGLPVKTTSPGFIAVQVVGVILGVLGGLALFGAVTG
ncbi:MAG: hypothetical protein JW733_02250 [Coriobacteriia bacterium]|nr:hypothetical protein [Coriobacteriia bacterium]MBN2840481.1 hypothetical protein [Coriobacteriia bacterium]